MIAKAVGLEPVEQLHREDDVGGRAARLLDVFSSAAGRRLTGPGRAGKLRFGQEVKGMAPSFRLSPAIRDRILDVIWRHLSPVDWDVILFGSFARGTATVASDIDLAVRGRAPLPAAVAARLVADLEDGVPMLREYDVVDLAVAGPALRHRIEAEGETWHRAAART